MLKTAAVSPCCLRLNEYIYEREMDIYKDRGEREHACCFYVISHTHRRITSSWSCVRSESQQPLSCHSNTDTWCGRGCDGSEIWQVECFYLQENVCVFACVCVSVWLCVPYAVRLGGLSATYWCAYVVVNNSSKHIQRWQL